MEIDVNKPGQLLVWAATCQRARRHYVGIVSGRKQTVANHWADYCAGRDTPKKLRAAFAEHGTKCWRVVVLAKARNLEHLAQLERHYVKVFDSFKNGYNGNGGGAPTWADYWQDPEYRKNMLKKMSKSVERQWQDPTVRKKRLKAAERLWQDPAFRKRHSAGLLRQWQDPTFRKKVSTGVSKATKKRWQDPEYRAKMIAAQSAGTKRMWQDPKYRKRQSEKHTTTMLRLWQDPEFRKRQVGIFSRIKIKTGG